ncbi:MAG: DNA-binding protein [Deltaproteobacteria bacterium]|nr:MAG: DNA-binding protein [Deltaproteobacteria bacterium]
MESSVKISIELSEEQAKSPLNAADRLWLKPEELARASLADLLGWLQEDFQKAAGYVLKKNEELYRRLNTGCVSRAL